MTLFVCPRCYRFAPQVQLAAVIHRMKYGRNIPQIDEWLAKATEPTFDMVQHVLKTHGLADAGEPPLEPYEPKKIIVPVGAA